MPCRSSEITIGMSGPAMPRIASSRLPSGSSSPSAPIAPCIETRIASAPGTAGSIAASNCCRSRVQPAAESSPALPARALIVGTTVTSGLAPNTCRLPPTAVFRPRWPSISSPRWIAKFSYWDGSGLKDEISCMHSASTIRGNS